MSKRKNWFWKQFMRTPWNVWRISSDKLGMDASLAMDCGLINVSEISTSCIRRQTDQAQWQTNTICFTPAWWSIEQNIPAVLPRISSRFLTKQQHQKWTNADERISGYIDWKNIGESKGADSKQSNELPIAIKYHYRGAEEPTGRVLHSSCFYTANRMDDFLPFIRLLQTAAFKIILFMIWICMYSEKSSTADCAAVWWKS